VKPLLLTEPLTDGVITIRHWRDEDVPAIVAACQDPEIPRWTSVPEHYTEADSRAFMADLRPAMDAGERCAFGVIEGGAVAGAIGFPRLSWENERAEVGYWLAAHARGRGIAKRAVKLGLRPGLSPDRADRFDGEPGQPGGRRACRVHPRGRAAPLHARQGRVARHGDVLAPRR
jgi:RimJ/RimL family protein N-acetyltransferase